MIDMSRDKRSNNAERNSTPGHHFQSANQANPGRPICPPFAGVWGAVSGSLAAALARAVVPLFQVKKGACLVRHASLSGGGQASILTLPYHAHSWALLPYSHTVLLHTNTRLCTHTVCAQCNAIHLDSPDTAAPPSPLLTPTLPRPYFRRGAECRVIRSQVVCSIVVHTPVPGVIFAQAEGQQHRARASCLSTAQ